MGDIIMANALAVLNRFLRGQFVVASIPRGINLGQLLERNDLAALNAAKGWGFRCQDGHVQPLNFAEFYMVLAAVHNVRTRLVENAALLREKKVKHAQVHVQFEGSSGEMDCAKLKKYFTGFNLVLFPPPIHLDDLRLDEIK